MIRSQLKGGQEKENRKSANLSFRRHYKFEVKLLTNQGGTVSVWYKIGILSESEQEYTGFPG
jgi:hypothetical protein